MKNKSKILAFLILIFTIITTGLTYPYLPNKIPVHWNLSGDIDNFINKQTYVFIPTIFTIFMIALMICLPKIDQKKDNYKNFSKYYDLCLLSILTFFFLIHCITLSISLGLNININKLIPTLLGLLFIVIGYAVQKTELNYLFGVKTPWSLSGEVSWVKTNTLYGKLIIVSGALTILSTLLLNSNITFIVLIASVLSSSLISVICSYFYYKTK